MRSFVLNELLLLSRRERRARKFHFHPKTTVVRGANDTGKSSLLKSIYRCFGAEPQIVHDLWKGAHVQSVATFTIDGIQYSLHQDGNQYTIYDASKERLRSFNSVTTGLGPYLASLFHFRLQLASRQNESLVPPPAFLFLPFYIDQDKSWAEPWAAFSRLGQFSNWKKDLAEYHTGIKPNEYYEAKGEYEALREKLAPLTSKRDILRGVLSDLEQKLQVASFGLDIEQYRAEIKQLLVVCDSMKKKEEETKERLITLYNAKTVVEAQITIANNTLGELKKDYNYASSQAVEDHVDCPTCGATYTNSFAERFAIAQDEDRCHELLSELNEEKAGFDMQIARENERFTRASTETARVAEILATKQGEVELKDLLESEGRKEVQKILRADIQTIEAQMSDLDDKIQRMSNQMQSYTSKERAKEITAEFRDYMRDHLIHLSVETLQADSLFVHSRITEQGSDLPRALLAYYFAILQVMKKHSTSTFCPLIIDSPNQQDQDRTNMVRMLNFIRDKRPAESQLVLGLVDQFGVEFDGDVIELQDKHQLLSEENYEELSEELRELMMNSEDG